MRRRGRSIAWLLALGASFAAPLAQPSALPAGAAERIDALFSVWNAPDRPGCAVGVVERGELAFARGYGMANLEHGVPITPSSVFDIGSVSKQFTAASIALLVIDGKLSLDDDIHRFIPELPAVRDTRDRAPPAPPSRRPQGLHRSARRRGRRHTPTSRPAPRRWRRSSRQRGVDFPAGERYEYSNTGYFLLGVIVERASGMPLARFAEERIFRPLGMRSTHFHDDHTRSCGIGPGLLDAAWQHARRRSPCRTGSRSATAASSRRSRTWRAGWRTSRAAQVGGPRFLELMAVPGLPTTTSDGAATLWPGPTSRQLAGSADGAPRRLLGGLPGAPAAPAERAARGRDPLQRGRGGWARRKGRAGSGTRSRRPPRRATGQPRSSSVTRRSSTARERSGAAATCASSATGSSPWAGSVHGEERRRSMPKARCSRPASSTRTAMPTTASANTRTPSAR